MANAVTNLAVKWGLQLMIQSLQEEPGLADQTLLQLPERVVRFFILSTSLLSENSHESQ